MEKETIGVIGSLSGVALGAILSQSIEWWKRRRAEKRTLKAVRLFVYLEIKKNIGLLGLFWSEVRKKAGIEKEDEIGTSRCAKAVGETAFPILSRAGWDAHIDRVTDVFGVEGIVGVWDFYEDLSQLALLHSVIAESLVKADDTSRSAGLGFKNIAFSSYFEKSATRPFEQFKLTIEGILNKGIEDIVHS